MGKNKRDVVWDNYYTKHLNGGRASNPAVDVLAATQIMYTDTLVELCANRFEWKGLPKSISPRFLEMTLFNYGLSVFYEEDSIGEYVALQAAGVGLPNYQGDPVAYNVIAPGADNIQRTISIDDCVPIYANYMRIPELNKVMLYAKKLGNLDRSIEITAEGMRYSKVVFVDENERMSYVNLMRQHAEGQPLIMGSKRLDMANIQAFDIGVPTGALADLMTAKAKTWNECMSMLGINNNGGEQKRERLVADEVSANDAQIGAMQNVALNARQFACKQIREKFGVEVSVDFKQTLSIEPASDRTSTGENEDEDKD